MLIHPCRTTSVIRALRSRTSSSMVSSRPAHDRRQSGRSTRSRVRPTTVAARSETMTDTNSAIRSTATTAPATPPRTTALGRPPAPNSRAPTPTTGSATRARMFQTPLTITEVEMSRRPKPHERHRA